MSLSKKQAAGKATEVVLSPVCLIDDCDRRCRFEMLARRYCETEEGKRKRQAESTLLADGYIRVDKRSALTNVKALSASGLHALLQESF